MECTLAALIACFSWSNLYLDADLTYLDARIPRYEYHVQTIQHSWGQENIGNWALNHRPQNPYNRVAIGYEVQFRSVTVSLEGWHLSSVKDDNDKGMNAVSLRARWFPFR